MRLLDKGTMQDHLDRQLEFTVVELAEFQVKQHVFEVDGSERTARICRVALGALKGLFDMHKLGLLHRDMKPGF